MIENGVIFKQETEGWIVWQVRALEPALKTGMKGTTSKSKCDALSSETSGWMGCPSSVQTK